MVPHGTFHKRHLAFQLFLVFWLAVLIFLTLTVKHVAYFSFDLVITRAIQQIDLPGFAGLMAFISSLGNPIEGSVFVVIVTLIFVAIRMRSAAVILFCSTIGLELFGMVIKFWVHRPRPSATLIHQQIAIDIRYDSFPSGHVLLFLSLFGFILFWAYTTLPHTHVRRLLIALSIFLTVCIGISRIYVGAHWFSDVLGAYILGSLWLFGVSTVYHHFSHLDKKSAF